MIGATMRHEHAGLSIRDFPLAYGQVWPKTDPASVDAIQSRRASRTMNCATTALYINMQMAHRVGAVLVTVAILGRRRRDVAHTRHRRPSCAAGARSGSFLSFSSSALGAFTIWTNKAADVATTHVAVGALTLVLGALLTAMSWRLQSQRGTCEK